MILRLIRETKLVLFLSNNKDLLLTKTTKYNDLYLDNKVNFSYISNMNNYEFLNIYDNIFNEWK